MDVLLFCLFCLCFIFFSFSFTLRSVYLSSNKNVLQQNKLISIISLTYFFLHLFVLVRVTIFYLLIFPFLISVFLSWYLKGKKSIWKSIHPYEPWYTFPRFRTPLLLKDHAKKLVFLDVISKLM